MRKLFGVVACGIALSLAVNFSAGQEPQNKKPEDRKKVSLVRIGTRSYSDGRESIQLFAVMIGDTLRAEIAANKREEMGLGPYAIDGTIWKCSDESSGDKWMEITYSAPRTIEEMETFMEHPELFMDKKEGGAEILPYPFKKLNDSNLARIDFIVSYKAGGMKAYIFPESDAEALFEAVRSLSNAI
jgi:hypothetical protein